MGFTEEELDAGDYKMDKMRDDGLILQYGERAAEICFECGCVLQQAMIRNIKIDNGDPDFVIADYCLNCDEPPKIEKPTKAMMGHTWD